MKQYVSKYGFYIEKKTTLLFSVPLNLRSLLTNSYEILQVWMLIESKEEKMELRYFPNLWKEVPSYERLKGMHCLWNFRNFYILPKFILVTVIKWHVNGCFIRLFKGELLGPGYASENICVPKTYFIFRDIINSITKEIYLADN